MDVKLSIVWEVIIYHKWYLRNQKVGKNQVLTHKKLLLEENIEKT